MPVDKTKLLGWLKDRAATKNPVIGAIYTGLATRIERGEFDQGKER